MTEPGTIFLHPDRKDEQPRFGALGGIRQLIESIIDSISRIAQRLLALAATLWHNRNIGKPGRHLTAYDH
jgi:hypothetical protein